MINDENNVINSIYNLKKTIIIISNSIDNFNNCD